MVPGATRPARPARCLPEDCEHLYYTQAINAVLHLSNKRSSMKSRPSWWHTSRAITLRTRDLMLVVAHMRIPTTENHKITAPGAEERGHAALVVVEDAAVQA